MNTDESAHRGGEVVAPDMLGDAFLADPYPGYALLREHDPVHWDAATGSWYVTRYQDVYELLADPRLTSPSVGLRVHRPELRAPLARTLEFFDAWMVFSDSPATQRTRGSLQGAFSPAGVRALEAEITRLATAAVDTFPGPGRADLLADLAHPFARSVIAVLLGIAESELAQVGVWSAALMDFLDVLSRSAVDFERARSVTRIIDDLSEYVTHTVLPRGDGLLAPVFRDLLRTGGADETAVAATFAHVLTGGLDPVSTTVGVGVLALHDAPEQWSAVRAGAISHEAAVEEALRYDSPFHFASRGATEDIRLGGAVIRRGDRVALGLASANRDERHFACADRFDARRPRRQHLAFGRGSHYCLGSFLARRELTVLLQQLARRFPVLRVERSEALRVPMLGATGFQRIPVFV